MSDTAMLREFADKMFPDENELRQSLANVLTLARIKWGNLDPDANQVFEHAEALLARVAT